ncbi:MAG: hypothetical protein AB7H77_06355 [Bdellovibrionales bacterium]
MKRACCALLFALLAAPSGAVPARAADMPLAAGSPLAGLTFDDRPLLLPVQRNFQMALLTVSGELGRSCGKMEAYGWRMQQSEQDRVDQIFNNTVDRLRGLGYAVETQLPTSVSRDVTIFAADRPDKHFIFMWSAGEIGLVMTLCETGAPLAGRAGTKSSSGKTDGAVSQAGDVLASELKAVPAEKPVKDKAGNFSPVGKWVGSYSCGQGYTGGTMEITGLSGNKFNGSFRFYPTKKNRKAASGSYQIFGQYDAKSKRILINPGKWIKRPKGYDNTIIVGDFDPANHSFSGFFQGISGCTSFEARRSGVSHEVAESKAGEKPAKKKKATKKAKKAKPKEATPAAEAESQMKPAVSESRAGGAPSPGITVGHPAEPSSAPAATTTGQAAAPPPAATASPAAEAPKEAAQPAPQPAESSMPKMPPPPTTAPSAAATEPQPPPAPTK